MTSTVTGPSALWYVLWQLVDDVVLVQAAYSAQTFAVPSSNNSRPHPTWCPSWRLQGPHTGMNTDSVTFDMDRPTFEDQRAIDDYYNLNYDPATDDKPFSSGRLE